MGFLKMKMKIKKSTAKKLGNFKKNIIDFLATGIVTVGFIMFGLIIIWIGIEDPDTMFLTLIGMLFLGMGIYLSYHLLEDMFIEYVE